MKIGDKVWIILQCGSPLSFGSVPYDDGRNIRLPDIPQHGKIVAVSKIYIESHRVLVGRCSLLVSFSDTFLSEDSAWAEWKYRMKNKCVEIEESIDNIIEKRFHV